MSAGSILLPLRERVYRRIWTTSVLSNLGQMIGAVGAAWAMTQLSGDPKIVALVQTASMLPMMLWSLPAGAIADMFDRRKVAMLGLAIAFASALSLWLLSSADLITPAILLLFLFLIGSGIALFSPAWQSSVIEQVPRNVMPQAIALTAISFNIARSFGPAIGGTIVAAAGATAAFITNALFYLPLLIVFFLWRRPNVVPKLPPERVDRAIVAGFRYVFHSPSIRVVMVRTMLMGVIGASISSLMPLIARDLLGGGPSTYGIILGSFGAGSIVGALSVSTLRERLSGESASRLCLLGYGAATIVAGLSRSIWTTIPAMLIAGLAYMLLLALFNISVQTVAPRWVTGRVLATFQASITGGLALGSWLWGEAADQAGISGALILSGILMIASTAAGFWLRMPEPTAPVEEELVSHAEPAVALALTPRSGPIIIEIEYRIAPADAREFYSRMLQIQLSRQRNGAFGWSLARDVSDPAVWVERFHCATWLDYLRARTRSTPADRALQEEVEGFQTPGQPIRLRRMLERPIGSVRWKDTATDPGTPDVVQLT